MNKAIWAVFILMFGLSVLSTSNALACGGGSGGEGGGEPEVELEDLSVHAE